MAPAEERREERMALCVWGKHSVMDITPGRVVRDRWKDRSVKAEQTTGSG